MRIELTTEGGFAYFPGLSRPINVDTAVLPPAEAARFEGLVRAARFFTLPPEVGSAKGAADVQTHVITVADGAQSRTVRAVEPVTDAALLQLVEAVRAMR